jgi:hypothetical protein
MSLGMRPMSDMKFTAGGAIELEVSRNFIHAGHAPRAARAFTYPMRGARPPGRPDLPGQWLAEMEESSARSVIRQSR